MSASAKLEEIHGRVERLSLHPRRTRTGFQSRCPTHDDQNPSFSVDLRNGKVLIRCHAGCPTKDALAALGIGWSDLFEDAGPSRKSAPVATYPYTDEHGNLLFQAVRLPGKVFRQRRPNGKEGWLWNLHGVRRVPYRLPEVVAAVAKGDPVFIVEGEKDADRLAREGLTATCNPMGAGKWRKEFAPLFKGAVVAVIPDNDVAGRKHAESVANSLKNLADDIRVVEFPELPEGGDVSDWFENGGTASDLLQLLARTPRWGEEPTTTRRRSRRVSDIRPERIEWLWRRLIAKGFLNLIFGMTGVGKSTVNYDLAARISREGGVVLIATAEDHANAIVRPRLEAAGADLTRVHLWTEPLTLPEDCNRLREEAETLEAVLVIVDPLVAFLAGEINTHRDASVRRALAPLAKMGEELKVAVVVVLHTNRTASDDPLIRVSGSGGFAAAARHVLLAAADPSDETGLRRVLAVVKSNLASFPAPLAYRLEPTTIPDPEGGEAISTSKVVWGEELKGFDPRILLRPPPNEEEKNDQEEAQDFLTAAGILESARPAAELIKEGEAAGLHHKTLQRARRALGIRAWKRDMTEWIWGPKPSEVDSSEADNQSPVQLSNSGRPAETTPNSLEVDREIDERPPSLIALDEATNRVRAADLELYRR
jgi:putative DNA primase/helicase